MSYPSFKFGLSFLLSSIPIIHIRVYWRYAESHNCRIGFHLVLKAHIIIIKYLTFHDRFNLLGTTKTLQLWFSRTCIYSVSSYGYINNLNLNPLFILLSLRTAPPQIGLRVWSCICSAWICPLAAGSWARTEHLIKVGIQTSCRNLELILYSIIHYAISLDYFLVNPGPKADIVC